MALSSAKHERIHNKTGSDLAAIKANFDNGKHLDAIDFPVESAIMYQIQKMQEELDYLRTEISTNKDKVSMTLGTSGSTALAGNTKIPTYETSSDTNIEIGNMDTTTTNKGTLYTLPITVTQSGTDKNGNPTTTTKTGSITLT
jgi:hypothetical protein